MVGRQPMAMSSSRQSLHQARSVLRLMPASAASSLLDFAFMMVR